MTTLDYIIALTGLAVFLWVNLRLRRKGGRDLENFFLAGRSMSWKLLGLSMVATTFAADTPLWVTEKVVQHGISGNWLWWNMLLGGMLTTFFFAKYWRRAGIVTEPEFISLRYSGPLVKPLRMFKAVYLGLFLNAVIIGWVNAAMIKVVGEFFELPHSSAVYVVMALMIYTAIYSAISGLIGIVVTDAIQFGVAMAGSILLAILVVNLPEVGGLSGMVGKLPEWRFDFFPRVKATSTDILTISTGAFFSFVALQWWNSWYPGAEPGGGGYISQRMLSARNERDARKASLFFQLAHYCLRPWPWIVVALAALILYPGLPVEEAGNSYIRLIREYMPVGVRGLMLLVFISAYMSTISTQLNWGSGYLTNDLFLLWKSAHVKDPTEPVRAGRIFTLLIMMAGGVVSFYIDTIDQAARFLIQAGAGLGAVLILRWYWWRINALTELTATIVPLIILLICKLWIEPLAGREYMLHNGTFYVVVFGTMISWITVAYASTPTTTAILKSFCAKVNPAGVWPKDIHTADNKEMKENAALWIASVILAYSILFGTGYVLFGKTFHAVISIIIAAISGIYLTVRLHSDAR